MDNFNNGYSFSLLNRKPLDADFTGGNLSSDGGLLALAQLDRRTGFTEGFAGCLEERRQRGKIVHSLRDLVRQRIYQIACGYEDANDANALRADPVFKSAVGRGPEHDLDLGSQPTLSRLENEITWKELRQLGRFVVEQFVLRHRKQRVIRIVLDLDATEDPTHGQQELHYYNHHYRSHCFLPLHVYATVTVGQGRRRVQLSEQELVVSMLRPSSRGAAHRASWVIRALVRRFRRAWPGAEIILRADSGFANPKVMQTCDELGIGYCLGIATNPVIERLSEPWRARARNAYWDQPLPQDGKVRASLRRFGQFTYQAGSWTHPRRVVVKAEVMHQGENPRYVVHDRLPKDLHRPKATYNFYCGRGDPENRIKEYKCDLRADKTSCHSFVANQFRLLLHAAAYVLFQAMRPLLAGTEWAHAQVRTLQLKLIKIAARVRESHRRVYVQWASSYPYQSVFGRLMRAIEAFDTT